MPAESTYLGLGSNLGNRTANLCAGLDALGGAGLTIRSVSSFYLAEPEDSARNDDPWYVNSVVAVGGATDASELLHLCLEIEQRHGRVRDNSGRPRPRRLDVDILMFGDATIDEPSLRVPHPRMHERRFVLEPLSEIAPQARHPVEQASVAELLERLRAGDRVWLLAPPPLLSTPGTA